MASVSTLPFLKSRLYASRDILMWNSILDTRFHTLNWDFSLNRDSLNRDFIVVIKGNFFWPQNSLQQGIQIRYNGVTVYIEVIQQSFTACSARTLSRNFTVLKLSEISFYFVITIRLNYGGQKIFPPKRWEREKKNTFSSYSSSSVVWKETEKIVSSAFSAFF